MILIEDIFFNEKKQKIIKIRIHSACCNSIFCVIDESPNKLYNPVTGEYLPLGMIKSIRLVEEQHNERISK